MSILNNDILNIKLPPPQKAVFLALCSRANHQTLKCWPSIPTIAKDSCFSETTVRRALRALKEKNYIEIINRKDGKESKSNVYYLKYIEKLNLYTDLIKVIHTPCQSDTTPLAECYPSPSRVEPDPWQSDTLTTKEIKREEKKEQCFCPSDSSVNQLFEFSRTLPKHLVPNFEEQELKEVICEKLNDDMKRNGVSSQHAINRLKKLMQSHQLKRITKKEEPLLTKHEEKEIERLFQIAKNQRNLGVDDDKILNSIKRKVEEKKHPDTLYFKSKINKIEELQNMKHGDIMNASIIDMKRMVGSG